MRPGESDRLFTDGKVRLRRSLTSDHRVAGSSPAGCRSRHRADMRTIRHPKNLPRKLCSAIYPPLRIPCDGGKPLVGILLNWQRAVSAGQLVRRRAKRNSGSLCHGSNPCDAATSVPTVYGAFAKRTRSLVMAVSLRQPDNIMARSLPPARR
jgi:hypothetical protein